MAEAIKGWWLALLDRLGLGESDEEREAADAHEAFRQVIDSPPDLGEKPD